MGSCELSYYSYNKTCFYMVYSELSYPFFACSSTYSTKTSPELNYPFSVVQTKLGRDDVMLLFINFSMVLSKL